MAEWSKAPDSRFYLTFMIGSVYREFWSSYEGVGSNPTSDSNFFNCTDLPASFCVDTRK